MLWKTILSRFTKKSRIGGRHNRKNMVSKVQGNGCRDDCELGKRKTRSWRFKSNKNGVKKKQNIDVNGGDFDRNGEIDRISELPESIIHQIFNFLHCTKDVVRTTVLSKNWKSMFDSYHSFDFDQRWFRLRGGKGKHNRIKAREVQKKRFKRYVDNSLATRLDPLVSIDRFRLCVDNVDTKMANCAANWIRAAIDKDVKELDVQAHRGGILVLPKNVVMCPSITSLKMSGSMLYNFFSLKLCNLRELSIKDCRLFNVYVMEKFEESCSLLEDLRLVSCPEISHLAISSLVKLRRVEVQDCPRINRIEITGSYRLESFWYHAKKNQRCKIDLRDTENLKNLTLKDRTMTDSAFGDWVFKCPLLEKLVLHECYRLKKMKIISEKLKSLSLIKCVKLCEVNIDAPNLYSLEYSGHMIPFRFMKASRLSQVKFSYGPRTRPQSEWTFGCQDFLFNFDGLKGFKLITHSKQNMKIFEEACEAPLDGNIFEKIEITLSSAGIIKTVDNWLRECHGKNLILQVSANSEIIKLISTMIMDREDHLSCCSYFSNKCWRHYIEDVKVSTLKIRNETCYEFTWKSRKS